MTEALNSNGVFCVHHLIKDPVLYFLYLYNKKKHLSYSSLLYQLSGYSVYGCSVNVTDSSIYRRCLRHFRCVYSAETFDQYTIFHRHFYCVSLHFFEDSIIKEMKYSQCTYILSLLQISRMKKSNGVFTPFCACCSFCLWYSNQSEVVLRPSDKNNVLERFKEAWRLSDVRYSLYTITVF